VIGVWVREHCVRHPRISGGVVVMLRHLNDFLRKGNYPPCSLDEFRALLGHNSLRVIEVRGTLLVAGMGLKEDWRWAAPRRR
jgi:hypothetical protein